MSIYFYDILRDVGPGLDGLLSDLLSDSGVE